MDPANVENVDIAWEYFCDDSQHKPTEELISITPKATILTGGAPESTSIYISTKTKISYLNQIINLNGTFWNIPVIPYHLPQEGVVKKQMKFNSGSQAELEELQERTKKECCVDEHIITRIVNPEGRIKFKDVRKISIGLCKRDIVSYRRKKRGAFYNCFVMIMRIQCDNLFKEIHVKVFNTGKLEIPGIQNEDTLTKVLQLVTKTLAPLVQTELPLICDSDKTDTVLINSNFNCGYFIDRDRLYNELRYRYIINSAYDPCSYPGIQCEFYYNPTICEQTGQQPIGDAMTENIVKVSFMIFRTGSVLIVGKCSEEILEIIYQFLKSLLKEEYSRCGCPGLSHEEKNGKKIKKIRRKLILLG